MLAISAAQRRLLLAQPALPGYRQSPASQPQQEVGRDTALGRVVEPALDQPRQHPVTGAGLSVGVDRRRRRAVQPAPRQDACHAAAHRMILVDTNVFSELWRVAPDPGVLSWVDAQARPQRPASRQCEGAGDSTAHQPDPHHRGRAAAAAARQDPWRQPHREELAGIPRAQWPSWTPCWHRPVSSWRHWGLNGPGCDSCAWTSSCRATTFPMPGWRPPWITWANIW